MSNDYSRSGLGVASGGLVILLLVPVATPADAAARSSNANNTGLAHADWLYEGMRNGGHSGAAYAATSASDEATLTEYRPYRARSARRLRRASRARRSV
jgi:hypothetical protein